MANVGTAQNSPLLNPAQLAALRKSTADYLASADANINAIASEISGRCFADPLCLPARAGSSWKGVEIAYSVYADWRRVALEIVNAGTISGGPITQFQAQNILRAGSNAIGTYADAVGIFLNSLPTSIALNAVLAPATRLAETGNQMFNAMDQILQGLAATGSGIGTGLKWLPAIVVGLLVLPFLFRTGAAYKRGGSAAALEEAAGQIERGRSAAGRGAKSLLTRGVAGMSRRQRSR